MLALALGLGAHTTTFGQTKPIVFEVRDKQKVEAESGQLTVPERRGTKRARLISLSFIGLKSTAEKPASPIVYLAGGPGALQSATLRKSRRVFRTISIL